MAIHRGAYALALVVALAGAGVAARGAGLTGESSAWAFPLPPPGAPAKAVSPARHGLTVPGSGRRYDQVNDLFNAVDWFPGRHPAAPRPVLMGRKPDAMACGYCHLPDGQGRPENASLAGLPAAYISEQVRDMHAGVRSGADPAWAPTALMTRVARGASPGEVAAAAGYYASLKYQKVFRLVEAQAIPGVTPTFGLYRQKPGAGRERLGARIIEVPNDYDRFELRDNRPGYTIYVPIGAIGRGQALAEHGGDGRFPACSRCHGAHLTGALGPPLAGRYPTYLFRQLLSFAVGGRTGPDAAMMRPVVRRMKPGDMIDLAAYAASLKP